MNKSRKNLLVLILGLLVAIGPFSIDMYLPAFQIIARDFGTTISNVGLSMSSYFVGMAAGQLLYGPLLDRFGRKWPLYIGLVFYIAASVACTVAGSIDQMIVYRFIQAVGGCSASVAAFAIVRDIFPVQDNAKIFSSLLLVISASPLVAPSVGSFVSISLGWQSVFYILIAMTVIIVMMVMVFLPESKGPDPTYSLKPRPILNNFFTVLRNPQFLTYAAGGGISFCGLITFVTNSPFLYMKLAHLDEAQFGILFAVMVGGMIAASQINSLLLRKYTSEQLITGAIRVQVTFGILILAATYFNLLGFVGQTGLIFVFLATTGIILPNSSALCLAPFSENTGSASALMGALQLGFGSISSFVVSVTSADTAIPLTMSMAISATVAFLIFTTGRSRIAVAASASASADHFNH